MLLPFACSPFVLSACLFSHALSQHTQANSSFRLSSIPHSLAFPFSNAIKKLRQSLVRSAEVVSRCFYRRNSSSPPSAQLAVGSPLNFGNRSVLLRGFLVFPDTRSRLFSLVSFPLNVLGKSILDSKYISFPTETIIWIFDTDAFFRTGN